ncbi:MAG: hypothetical protein LBQ34_00545, partial [Alphaproteobacteria bacterium]|nr:hypothetical protein [Alphaproteobacteria bacterium]
MNEVSIGDVASIVTIGYYIGTFVRWLYTEPLIVGLVSGLFGLYTSYKFKIKTILRKIAIVISFIIGVFIFVFIMAHILNVGMTNKKDIIG